MYIYIYVCIYIYVYTVNVQIVKYMMSLKVDEDVKLVQ